MQCNVMHYRYGADPAVFPDPVPGFDGTSEYVIEDSLLVPHDIAPGDYGAGRSADHALAPPPPRAPVWSWCARRVRPSALRTMPCAAASRAGVVCAPHAHRRCDARASAPQNHLKRLCPLSRPRSRARAVDVVLGWRWDCEMSSQVWSSCADITIE